jgi:hypothetical protein
VSAVTQGGEVSQARHNVGDPFSPKGFPMTRSIIAAVGRALSARPSNVGTDHPHFHQGAQGNAAACFASGCDRPRLHV